MTRKATEGETVVFGLAGGEVHVLTPDPTVAEVISSLFPDYRKEEPDVASCVHRIEVGYLEGSSDDGRDRAYRIHAGGSSSVTPDPIAMLTTVEGGIARGLLRAASARVHLHAAGVRVGNSALLALGTRGAGKSSLALAWSVMGLPVLGDDVVFVDEVGRADSFRRLFKVDPELLESHGIDPGTTPVWAEGAAEAWFDPRAAGGWSDGYVPVRAVVVLEGRIAEERDPFRSGGGGGGSREGAAGRRGESPQPWSLASVEPAEALNDLLASVVWTGRSREASLDPLLALLDGCDAHRLSFASSARAARGLVELMNG
ncbi:MAG: hypothetical protein ACLFWG_08725 [Longimicrobiales bacterium]